LRWISGGFIIKKIETEQDFYITELTVWRYERTKGKTIDYSRTVISQVMLPSEANPAGNVHGGEIMKMMDNAAFVVAVKHSRTNVVTARVDELVFHQPIYVGQLVTCHAHLVFVGRSSMEVSVTVEVEDLKLDKPPQRALTAYFTMVALDENGRPCEVPRLLLKDEKERAAFEEGKRRYEAHKRSRLRG
jgi:acyl-CoA hydrolase